MHLALLGPLEARDDAGAAIPVAGARVRTLLTRLALESGRSVGIDALLDAVWHDARLVEETNALQTLVSRLRRALGTAAAVTQSAAGYRLELAPVQVDVHRFERLVVEGGTALHGRDARRTSDVLGAALAMWRGPALADALAQSDALAPFATRLEELRLRARIDLAAARLATEPGSAAELIAELDELAAQNPLDERVAAQLVQALAVSGRQADALAAYERVRARLADELGVDPSTGLAQVHLAVLRGEYATDPAPVRRRTNLKAQLTSFVGRDAEVARIAKALEQNRLVTLVGTGGAGKTRLASEVAATTLDTAPDGTWFVELAQVTSGADVAQAVVTALGLRDAHVIERRTVPAARDATSRLLDILAHTRTLLVLDNCEHVIEAAASLSDQLLADNAELRILATSREPLGITGEALLAVPTLSRPEPGAGVEEALEYPAVRLFADRAAAVRAGFAVDDTTIGEVIQIVRRLDGLPLAIELAAARLRTLPLAEIAGRLSDRFKLLTGGSRTALPRHRTLRAVVEWSWELLSPPERELAEQLAVFPSGITVESAVAVSDRPDDVPELIASLIDKSLLVPVAEGTRVRMLETIREFGCEQLGERSELATVRARHADHFALLLASAEPHLTQHDQLPWFAKLGAELDNVVSALRFRADVGDADGALRMAVALGGYAMLLGNHPDIPEWVQEALAVPGATDRHAVSLARALVALNSAANVADGSVSGRAREELQLIETQLRDIDLTRWAPWIHLLRAAAAFFSDHAELTEEFLTAAARSDDPWACASSSMFEAMFAENEGDTATMRAKGEQALGQFRAIGERWGTTNSLRIVGQLAVLEGDLDAGAAAYEEALRLTSELSSHDDEGFVLGRLADIELRRGNIDRARRYIDRARTYAEKSGTAVEALFALAVLSGIERVAGNDEAARRSQDAAMARLGDLPAEHPAAEHVRSMLLGSELRHLLIDGDIVAASAVAATAYASAVATKDLPALASVGVPLAELVAARGDPRDAAQILGACARLRGGDDWTALDIAALRATLIDELDAGTFATEFERGKALDREAAIERLDPCS